MESQTTSTTATRLPDSDAPGLSKDALGHVFADERRRAVLRVLATADDAIEIDALTDAVADEERCSDGGADRFDRVLVSLYDQHLPLLADNGLLSLDHRGDRVFVRPNAAAIGALL